MLDLCVSQNVLYRLGVPRRRIIALPGLYWDPLIVGNSRKFHFFAIGITLGGSRDFAFLLLEAMRQKLCFNI